VSGSGPGGRILKEDAQAAQQASVEHPAPQTGSTPSAASALKTPVSNAQVSSSDEEVVPMSMLRRHIASRLVEAQQNAALLTTFNEIDMSAVMQLRKENQE